jgi:hypothetical protein
MFLQFNKDTLLIKLTIEYLLDNSIIEFISNNNTNITDISGNNNNDINLNQLDPLEICYKIIEKIKDSKDNIKYNINDNIKYIIIESNLITSLPDNFTCFDRLEKLELSGNLFYNVNCHQFPINISYLDIHNISNLSLDFFENIDYLENLQTIHISDFHLSLFPDFKRNKKLSTIIIHIESYNIYNEAIKTIVMNNNNLGNIVDNNSNNNLDNLVENNDVSSNTNTNIILKKLMKPIQINETINTVFLFHPLYDISHFGIITIFI